MAKKILGIQKLDSQWSMESPFLFCAHHQDHYPKANKELGPAVSLSGRNIGSDFSNKDGFSMYHGETVPGFPAHPHRGFETVTIVLNGFVDHFDSSGATGRYGNGDVQWLTTGGGCQHSEMFPLLNEDRENPIELFQIWLNLPESSKKAQPHYKMFWAEDIPVTSVTDTNNRKSTVKVISGQFGGVNSLEPAPDSWAHKQEHHVGIYLISMEPEAVLKIPATTATSNRNLYFYNGQDIISIDDFQIKPSNRIKLSNEDIELVNGKAEALLILLEGEPINEPVVQYGPFVMNSENGIRQAISEYQQTQYGGWPWSSYDVVHSKTTGRFARYADGIEEYK